MKSIVVVFILLTSLSMFGQLSNNAFNLNNDYGDLRMRRFVSGDLNWKRALVAGSGNLLINYAGDFSDGTRVMGHKFIIDGNTGIGTTSPQEKLHINGSIRGNSSGGALRVKTESGYLDLGAQNTGYAHIYTDRPRIIFNKDVYSATNSFSSYNDDLVLKTEGVARMRINDETGNIGIRESYPNAPMHIRPSNNDYLSTLKIGTQRRYFTEHVGPDITLNYQKSLDFHIENNGVAHIAVNSNGNSVKNGKLLLHGVVGIGDDNPKIASGFMLSVNGDAIAEEVHVQSTGLWPDYVFNENYTLMTLGSLEKFIVENKHLPNIPSAEEVKENDGIKLGQMNAKLLEKVEELTLYIIELHKRIEKLEKEKDE